MRKNPYVGPSNINSLGQIASNRPNSEHRPQDGARQTKQVATRAPPIALPVRSDWSGFYNSCAFSIRPWFWRGTEYLFFFPSPVRGAVSPCGSLVAVFIFFSANES